MKKMFSHRQSPTVNAGSMADIAFLLLIFFLVTTTINSDKGILVKLPIWVEEPPSQPIRSRNILNVFLNSDNELLVAGQVHPISSLKGQVKEFILNPEDNPNLAARPNAAIVSLIHDKSTNYSSYLSVYNELKMAYNELWESQSHSRFGQSYNSLDKVRQKQIRTDFPLVISEAEPTEY